MTDSFYCPQCHFGRCHPSEKTYVRMYKGKIITAPNVKIYICDVCGFSEFDGDALRILAQLAELPESTVAVDPEVPAIPGTSAVDIPDNTDKFKRVKP